MFTQSKHDNCMFRHDKWWREIFRGDFGSGFIRRFGASFIKLEELLHYSIVNKHGVRVIDPRYEVLIYILLKKLNIYGKNKLKKLEKERIRNSNLTYKEIITFVRDVINFRYEKILSYYLYLEIKGSVFIIRYLIQQLICLYLIYIGQIWKRSEKKSKNHYPCTLVNTIVNGKRTYNSEILSRIKSEECILMEK